MERDVRYCTTEDGVSIAYCVEGDGPITILAMPAFLESFSLDHLMPVYKQFYADLGAGRRVIRCDVRGTGLSSTIPPGVVLTREDFLRDVVAVIRAVGPPCVVWAPTTKGVPAIKLAVREPDLVSHLLLYGTFATVSDAWSDDLLDGIRSLVKSNWQMAAQTIADTNGRREFPSEAAQLGEWYYRSITGERFLQMSDDVRSMAEDVTPLLGEVAVPTLVLHRVEDPAIAFSAGQKLAAGIPDARFVPLDGSGHLFCLGDYSRILSSVDALLGDRVKDTAAPPAEGTAFHTILFTDVEGSTALTQRLGDAKARELLREHERIVREALKAHGGSEVKTMGDGFMASFSSATKALECAIAMQRAFAERNSARPEPVEGRAEEIRIRIGLNAGEPIAEDDDLFGTAVNEAARITATAKGGEILVSNVVRELAKGKDFLFADRGEANLKGFDEPVRLYEVRWQPDS